MTESSSADALDSLRRVAIGNDPLVSKVAAAAERSIFQLRSQKRYFDLYRKFGHNPLSKMCPS